MLSPLALGLGGNQELLRILEEDRAEIPTFLKETQMNQISNEPGGSVGTTGAQAVGQWPGDQWGNLYFICDIPGGAGGGNIRGQML